MTRKVFISFLGTNNYVECCYSSDPKYPVRFVQEALIRDICKDWTENDHIYIFCTTDAERLNWVDNGQTQINEDVDRIGLESRLNNLNIAVPYEKVHIKEGFSEEDIWDIFDTVYGKLSTGDQIYFDVTHAFRSIPLFSLVLFNYSRFVKGTQIISIKYGAFEKLGPAYEVRKKALEERGIAPVLDLTNIALLQEYNEMANNLVNFGKTKQLSSALQNSDSGNKVLDDLSQSITSLDEFIATNQLTEIRAGRFIAKFRCNVKAGSKSQPKPIKTILKKIQSETSDFVAMSDNRNIEAAIKWAKEHEMLAQAYSLAEEYIVLRVSEFYASVSPFGNDSKARKTFREFISLLLGLPENVVIDKNFHGVLQDQDAVIMQLWEEDFVQTIRPEYEKVRKRRNSIIHGNGEFPYHDEKGNDLDTDFYPIYTKCMAIINKFDQPCS